MIYPENGKTINFGFPGFKEGSPEFFTSSEFQRNSNG